MWDVFEQPWTLLGAAVLVLMGVLTFRSVVPEKKRWWHWLLPLAVAALAVGLDEFVATDLEKTNALVDTCLQAVEDEDCPTIARLLDDDYEDSFHTSKDRLMARCRDKLTPPAIESIKRISTATELEPPTARMIFTLLVKFDKESRWARMYKPSALIKIEVRMAKQPDGTWLISRIEILEADKMPVSWSLA